MSCLVVKKAAPFSIFFGGNENENEKTNKEAILVGREMGRINLSNLLIKLALIAPWSVAIKHFTSVTCPSTQ
jgi:hypothetical protein